MFFEFQAMQVHKWFLNPYMYTVVAGLSLLSLIFGIESLDRRYWTETAHDFFYGIAYAVLYAPIILISLQFANNAIDTYLPWLRLELIADSPIWIKFLVVILLDDFLAYWSHRLRHVVKPLWYFHTIHHSQTRLNPFTTKRFHPLENLFHKIVILLIPMSIIGGTMEIWYLYFLLDAVWDYFIHSNLHINLGPLKYIVVSPQYHRVHHSKERIHFDKNFSDRFVIWDYLFRTMHKDFDIYPATGIPNYPLHSKGSWKPWDFLVIHLRDLAYPFVMIANDIKASRHQ